MRPQKILDEEIIEGLTKVFRSNSYDSSSLQELAKVTGLKKASLYHRFPDGKQGMALAVITYLDNWVEENIFKELRNKNNSPQLRLENAIDNIIKFYKNGSEMCILNTLSVDSGSALFEKQIKSGMGKWIDAFQNIGIAFKLTPTESDEYALQALIEIQGSLIVAKGTSDITIFENSIQKIKDRYMKK